MSIESVQINLRIPQDVKIALQKRAEENGRSMNSEILYILRNELSPKRQGVLAVSLAEHLTSVSPDH